MGFQNYNSGFNFLMSAKASQVGCKFFLCVVLNLSLPVLYICNMGERFTFWSCVLSTYVARPLGKELPGNLFMMCRKPLLAEGCGPCHR